MTMALPIELQFGVDKAIKKLRPSAEFELQGNEITKWKDSSGSKPPSWAEISKQLEQDIKAATDFENANKAAWQAQRNRELAEANSLTNTGPVKDVV